MKHLVIPILCWTLLGCTNDEMTCSNDDRFGAYDIEFDKVRGDCDLDLEDEGTMTIIGGQSSDNCETTTDWSNDMCDFTRIAHCVYEDGTMDIALTTTQMTDDGSVLEGTVTISLRLNDGTSCRDTYDVAYNRH